MYETIKKKTNQLVLDLVKNLKTSALLFSRFLKNNLYFKY